MDLQQELKLHYVQHPGSEGMNRMDLNIVSSEHSKNVFLSSKFEKLDQNTKQKIGCCRNVKNQ